ncbi:helix-turn-helix domain-containing protein [Enterococcus faecalis]|uniref:helix-turn-helix domain-containing protein n=1 Tax=Enterococcus faecalis TaxID=1351 RepID=UPI0021DFB0E7|nr:helix-turn-helix domain-containing protein [Enterococcus faecalis]MCU9758199.1 helix-turn-helix domain-containing protein [Enterococcus faecalis]MCU9770436.1 helix-turn-helix domain-containing protein [Enterococcus faecalis]MCU9772796.1 helix-turn-helix domain-containing protein [Enterococcus faecalis]MCU9792168.1 helix-turn-helix domain-containing protein [Enterococcus faecalis]HEC4826975.1 helix-turn-helix domain-containing protein [Enterococcus faecalis]
MKNKKQCSSRNLLPGSVIAKAAQGDSLAMDVVLKTYKPYIYKLSMTCQYDQKGFVGNYPDEYIRRMLETKLIIAVTKFDINR